MIDRSKVRFSRTGRLFARLAIALCLIAFAFGGAVERGLEAHVSLGSALMLAVSADDSGDKLGGDFGSSAEFSDHGCHGCAAIAQPSPHSGAKRFVFAAAPAWTPAPPVLSSDPLVDLPPPRA